MLLYFDLLTPGLCEGETFSTSTDFIWIISSPQPLPWFVPVQQVFCISSRFDNCFSRLLCLGLLFTSWQKFVLELLSDLLFDHITDSGLPFAYLYEAWESSTQSE